MPPAAESVPDTSKYQSLKELTPQSAGIGTWLQQVVEAPQIWEYSHTYNGKPVKGKRFEVTLVSPDASVYCIGFARRKQDNLIGNGKLTEAVKTFRYKTVCGRPARSLWQKRSLALSAAP